MRDDRKLVFILAAWTLALLLLGAPRAHAQETEPNDSCLAAQNLGTAPLEVSGSLGSPDIDFFLFRVNNASGTAIIDLEGESLGDPLLGVFNSDCILLASDDDSGEGFNSRITIAAPPDGVLIVAATSYSDFGFTGLGSYSGSYRLRIGGESNALVVFGRVADATTGGESPSPSSTSTDASRGSASTSPVRPSPTSRGTSGSTTRSTSYPPGNICYRFSRTTT
jgi:hypothetical protein